MDERYALCRCGKSANKPFCDGTHTAEGFDGTETAATGTTGSQQVDHPGTNITVKDDRSICMHAGFCTNQITNVWQMTQDSANTQVRAQIMAMVERCPSGALSYALTPDGDILDPTFQKRSL